MDTTWIELLLIILGVLLNGFFEASEIALVSARSAAWLSSAARRPPRRRSG